jgi:hypothetical protein
MAWKTATLLATRTSALMTLHIMLNCSLAPLPEQFLLSGRVLSGLQHVKIAGLVGSHHGEKDASMLAAHDLCQLTCQDVKMERSFASLLFGHLRLKGHFYSDHCQGRPHCNHCPAALRGHLVPSLLCWKCGGCQT